MVLKEPAAADAADAGKSGASTPKSTAAEMTPTKSLSQIHESSSWDVKRRFLFHVLVSDYTERALGAVILTNLVILIVETDLTAVVGPGKGSVRKVPVMIVLLNRLLLAIYGAELTMRLYVLRMSFFYDGWCIVDFLVVGFDLVLFFVDMAVGPDMPQISVVRCLRLVRVARAFKALKMFPELDFLLSGFVRAFRAVVWGVIMLLIVIVVWAILAVQLINPVNRKVDASGMYEGCDRCPRAFDSVWNAVKTFSQQLLAGDSWGQVSLPIIDEEPWTYFFFLSVLVTVSLAIINLILAVIVDCGQQARLEAIQARENEEQAQFEEATAVFRRLCVEIDEDSSGSLTLSELQQGFDNFEEFAAAMRVMGVGREELEVMINVFDKDGSGDVDYDEFICEMHKAKQLDNHQMMSYMKFAMADMQKRNDACHKRFDQIVQQLVARPQDEPKPVLEDAKEVPPAKEQRIEAKWEPLLDKGSAVLLPPKVTSKSTQQEMLCTTDVQLTNVELVPQFSLPPWQISGLAQRSEAHARILSTLDHLLSLALDDGQAEAGLTRALADPANSEQRVCAGSGQALAKRQLNFDDCDGDSSHTGLPIDQSV